MASYESTTAMIAQLLSVGVAHADYQPAYDQTINLTLPMNVPDLGTAQASFQLQQQLQQQVTEVTGVSEDYYYIWVNVNGTPVLAIDPPCPMF
ncbi:MAG: 8-amino-7-oxononanoate synthase [Tumebacillaceae bacterium]